MGSDEGGQTFFPPLRLKNLQIVQEIKQLLNSPLQGKGQSSGVTFYNQKLRGKSSKLVLLKLRAGSRKIPGHCITLQQKIIHQSYKNQEKSYLLFQNLLLIFFCQRQEFLLKKVSYLLLVRTEPSKPIYTSGKNCILC